MMPSYILAYRKSNDYALSIHDSNKCSIISSAATSTAGAKISVSGVLLATGIRRQGTGNISIVASSFMAALPSGGFEGDAIAFGNIFRASA